MIKDTLENASTYYNLSEGIKNGLNWLENTNLEDLEDGKYEINGDYLYASVQTYNTKDDAKYESHHKYIDIQYIIKGIEQVGITNLGNCTTCVEYDSERDLEFYNINCSEEFVELTEGQFLILYPQDAHKPSIKKLLSSQVKKVVVKVKI